MWERDKLSSHQNNQVCSETPAVKSGPKEHNIEIYLFVVVVVPCILLRFTFITTNTRTRKSHTISVDKLIIKNKTLKHVSVFHKTILREPFVPAKVTYCPLLFFIVFFIKYAGNMSYSVCDGIGFHVTSFPYVDFLYPCVLCVDAGYKTKKTKSVALVRTRTIPTERPPPVGEVSANFCG